MLIPETAILTYDEKVLKEAGDLGEYLYDLLHDISKMYDDIANTFNTLQLGLALKERTSDPLAPAEG